MRRRVREDACNFLRSELVVLIRREEEVIFEGVHVGLEVRHGDGEVWQECGQQLRKKEVQSAKTDS